MRLMLLFVFALSVTGCGTLQRLRDADTQTNTDAGEASRILAAMKGDEAAMAAPQVLTVFENAQYAASTPIEVEDESNRMPACTINFAPQKPMSLLQFAQKVSKDCKIPVRVTPDALAAVRGTNAPQAAPAPPIPPPAGVTLPPPAGGFANRTSGDEERIDGLTYKNGDITDLLDAVSARLGLSWRYRDNAINIFYVETRSFWIHSIPTRTQTSLVTTSGTTTAAGVGGGSSGSTGSSDGGVSGSSGSTQTTTTTFDAAPKEDLDQLIEQMLTPNVGRSYIARATQTLMVTDTPAVLDQIHTFVKAVNAFSTKQVLINVKVLAVTTTNSSELGLDWSLVYTDLARSYGITLANTFASSADAVSGSVNILSGSRFDTTSAVIKALEKQGNVAVIKEPSVVTLNMEPAPIQIATQNGFFSGNTVAQTANVGSTTSRGTGTVTTGFNLYLLPYILDDNKTVLLQAAVNISSPPRFKTSGTGNDFTEVPEVDTTIFSQKVSIQSGQTLVIAGIEENSRSTNRSGVGSPRFWLFGGGGKGTTSRNVVVVLISPIVMRAP